MKSLFIINKRAGSRRRASVASLIRGEIIECERKEDLDGIIAGAEREQYDVVYAVGGDGTVHEIAKRLIGKKVALAILPTGSGNGLARHLGLPIESEACLRACDGGTIATIDTATVNDLPFVGVLGVGIDALIAHRFAASTVRGLRTYIKEGARTVAGMRAQRYEIEIDGVATSADAYIVAVANSSQYGNNARIAPLASLQDGLLDVVIVEKLSLTAFVRLFTGSLHRAKGIRVVQGRDVIIRRHAEGPAHVDGEPIDLPAELRARIVPQSLRVLVPRQSARI